MGLPNDSGLDVTSFSSNSEYWPQKLHQSVMSICSDKLAHVLVVINCQFSVSQMCTRGDTHARLCSPIRLTNTTQLSDIQMGV